MRSAPYCVAASALSIPILLDLPISENDTQHSFGGFLIYCGYAGSDAHRLTSRISFHSMSWKEENIMGSKHHRRSFFSASSNKSQLLMATRRVVIESLESRTLLTSVVVNNATDTATGTGVVTLRDAIKTADSSTSATTITFDPTVFATPKTIVLNGSPLVFSNTTEATTITGSTAGVTISGNGKSRGITINHATVTLSDLTIADCNYTGGAGIESDGTLVLTHSTVSGNDATSEDDGGGLALAGTSTLINDTIANNIGIGVLVEGKTTILDSTISGNSAYGDFSGGGVYDDTEAPSIGNTIIAGNTSATGGPDVSGAMTSLGHNLIGATTGSTGWGSTDLKGTSGTPLSAKLGSLANNGGPTETFLPQTGSPAIGAGSIALIPTGDTTDQRGLARTLAGKVDIGSVEVQPVVTLTVTAPAAQSAISGTSKSFALGSFTQVNGTGPYTVTVNWGDGSTNSSFTVSAAGTIPATAHTYTSSGTKTVTLSVKDATGHVSNSPTFSVSVAAVTITLTAPSAQTAVSGTSKSFTLGSFTQSNATGPFTVTVNWGDGSTNSSFSVSAAGTIPATAAHLHKQRQ